jgi:alpha-galactosidase
VGKKKIVLIGAGSAVFTRGLVADLIQAPHLGPWALGLVDVDPEALETAEGLVRRMVEARGADIALQASTDRRDVLPGADVVVTTIGVGGRRAWEADVFIPRKYGIYQPVGDTAMPGGISRALRMIPALVAIARDVHALCPGAWFFNYSNPMTANCWAIREATGVPVVGLCHGTFHVHRQLAAFIGAPPEEVSALYAGLNHMTFIYDLRWNGQDAWPLARARLRQASDPGVPDPQTAFAAENPFSWSLFEAYGAYPAANDRHVTEFFPERFPHGSYYGRTLGVDAYSFEGTIASGDRAYAAMRAQALGEVPLDEAVFRRGPGEHEQLVEILRCIWADERRVFAANLPVRGAVPGLPDDAILELPAVSTAGGLRALQLLDYPGVLTAILARKLSAIRLTAEAALQGDPALLREALLADGAVTDPQVAAQLGDELLATHRANLPQFFPQG